MSEPRTPLQRLGAFAGDGARPSLWAAGALTVCGIVAARTRYFTDDGAFFFRYAEHLAAGQGFRWNLSEPPIWGASAPLWPLLLAVAVRCGAAVEPAAVAFGYGLTIGAVTLLAWSAGRLAGTIEALAFGVLAAADFKLCFWATQGMEAPLAYLLLAACVACLTRGASWPVTGLIAGVCLIHKLDLAPAGVLLLVGRWLQTRRPPWRAALLATAVGGAWYAFAAWYFGSPLPNSLLTKLHAGVSVPRHWFFWVALADGSRKGLLLLALVGATALWKHRGVAVFCWGFVLVNVAAYALKPPPEPFEWYLAPVQPVLCLAAALGAGVLVRAGLGRLRLTSPSGRWATAVCALTLMGGLAVWSERHVARDRKTAIDTVERDRTEAGRWVAAHTPPTARVLTSFGNPAYYSRRYVYDGSYLNRRRPARPEDLILLHRPEVIVDCPYRTGKPPDEVPVPQGYRTAAVFDAARRAGIDFHARVLIREDAAFAQPSADRTSGRAPP
ncbi:MAG: hypothetical protein AMXMBFR83_07980 [Phycisphaerae bacterium]